MTKAHEPLPAGVDPCDLPGHGHKVLRLEEARARMVADIVPVAGDEVVDLRGALGRVLAGEVRSPVDVPSHRNSAMDGYALAGEELPSTGSASLEVVGTSWAGRPFVSSVGRGQCVRIMTGATLPDATDTVVMQEHVRLEQGRVVIEAGHHAGQNVRPVVEDIRRGDLALAAGAAQRDEIEIAKLIGATDGWIQRPFLYFGGLIGLTGGVAAWLLTALGLLIFNSQLRPLAALYGVPLQLAHLSWVDSLFALLFAAGLGWFGAWLSVRRHLSAHNPS